MCVYIYIYIYIKTSQVIADVSFCVAIGSRKRRGEPRGPVFRDFKDTVYIHSSNRIPCSSNVVCIVVSSLAILRIEGCLNSTL